MLKKAMSFLMAAVLCVGLSVPAYAASETVKSGDGSVTLSEVTSKETRTLNIGGKDETVVVYYCPSGTKVTIKPGASDTIGYGSSYYSLVGSSYNADIGGPGASFTVGASGYPLEEYYAVIGGESVYVMPNGKAQNPAKEDKPAQDTTAKTPAAAPVPAAPAAAAAPVYSGSGLVHTVKSGDTFGAMALNYYGDMTCWPAIYNVNADAINAAKNKQIYVGMELVIPTAVKHGDKNISAVAPAVAGSGEKLYTVRDGDTLGMIALAEYKDMSKYQAIFDRNADRLENANTIYAGQIIVLP